MSHIYCTSNLDNIREVRCKNVTHLLHLKFGQYKGDRNGDDSK